MLTKNDLRVKYGDDIAFLFKGDEPFTEVDGHPGGVVIQKGNEGIICFECGKAFKRLGNHLKNHSMSGKQYKKKYGISSKTALCTREESNHISLNNSVREYKPNSVSMDYARSFSIAKCKQLRDEGKLKSTSLQRQNALDICPAQVVKHYKRAMVRFGTNTPSSRQLDKLRGGLSFQISKHFGSLSNFQKVHGFDVRKMHQSEAEEIELIEAIRDYVGAKKRLPFNMKYGSNDFRKSIDGFPFGIGMYWRRFGSYRRAWLSCGIKKEGKEWVTFE